MRKFTRHLQHYLPLLGIFLACIAGFILFSYDKNFQTVLLIAAATGYVSWGIIHHYIHKDLYLSVIMEYISVAFFGVVIAISIIFRA